MISWKKLDPKTKIATLIVPDGGQSLPLGKVFVLANLKADYFPDKKNLHDLRYRLNFLIKILGAEKKINQITVQDLTQKVPPGKIDIMRSAIVMGIRLANDIPYVLREAESENPVSPVEVSGDVRKFHIKFFPEEELKNFILKPGYKSKHESFIMQIKEEISHITDGNFFVIAPYKNETFDRKEKKGRVLAVRKLFRNEKMLWDIQFSETRNCFVVFRKVEEEPKKKKVE